MAHAVDVTGHGGFGSIMMDAGFGMGLGEMMPGGRTGFGLGLGLGVGGAPLLWHRTLLEEEVIGDTWRIDGENGACFGATEAGGESWKDVGLTSPVDSCDGVLERKA
ncbi:hypothetical protein HPP92_019635 [Vanilla planifolia]|nr:hypothetical protein HPP92_019635 [Vanilla planifolia]